LVNLTRGEFGVNMGNSEQLCVNKELGGFDVYGNNYCVMKCLLKGNAFLSRNSNMFTIK
jgi:hypothetical protein